MRDADRIIGLLEANEIKSPMLVLNRIKPNMVKRGEMMALEDVTEILAIDVLGVVPDDESIVISTNKGEPCVADEKSRAGQAYRNITKRVLGESIPLMPMEDDGNLINKIKKFFMRG